jgi:single-strand DNA-binding protein
MLKMQVLGHLGKDAIVNNVNGKTVINFSVAHTEKYKEQSKTIWVDCSWWSEKTNITNYLKKGTQVYVEGNPEVRTYNTKEGNFNASLTLRVNFVQLLSSSGNKTENNNVNEITEPIDGLPF